MISHTCFCTTWSKCGFPSCWCCCDDESMAFTGLGAIGCRNCFSVPCCSCSYKRNLLLMRQVMTVFLNQHAVTFWILMFLYISPQFTKYISETCLNLFSYLTGMWCCLLEYVVSKNYKPKILFSMIQILFIKHIGNKVLQIFTSTCFCSSAHIHNVLFTYTKWSWQQLGQRQRWKYFSDFSDIKKPSKLWKQHSFLKQNKINTIKKLKHRPPPGAHLTDTMFQILDPLPSSDIRNRKIPPSWRW